MFITNVDSWGLQPIQDHDKGHHRDEEGTFSGHPGGVLNWAHR